MAIEKKARVPNDSEKIENTRKKDNKKMNTSAYFPIVGIGASAGGLQAFEAFFSGLLPDINPGMAFVLVQHLSPDHKSMLTEIIRRCTSLAIFEIEDSMEVKINCIYIIPPNSNIELVKGRLRLSEASEPRGHRLPIDFFFKSLAKDQHQRAIGIVLSGTGSDGTLGARAIKGEGGMIIAQTPESATFDGMPQSVIANGLVDYVLSPAEMPAQLIAYSARALKKPHSPATNNDPVTKSVLKKIIALLRTRSGHDFSQYKPTTIDRRIERRMALRQITKIDNYLKHLMQTPTEVQALLGDLLIGVTSFFRDPQVFRTLESEIIPKIFADKPAGSIIRVWSAGCSTGQEAYSIAMLLCEHMHELGQNYTLQVFATDIDSRAISKARAGLYKASLVADIAPARVARFFTATSDQSTYRISKEIRDMMVFSEQNLIKDPPFSKLDFISCRNLLIYLSAELQNKLIPMFHYALKPKGILLLGASEGVGEFGDLFSVLDRKLKLYQRKDNKKRMGIASLWGPSWASTMDLGAPRVKGEIILSPKLPLREIAEQALLQQLAPTAALVNAQGNILYLHGRTGMYLEPTQGEASVNNILKMAREGLRTALFTGLRKAVAQKKPVLVKGLNVKTNGHFTPTKLSIHPIATDSTAMLDSPIYLIILQEDILVAQATDLASREQIIGSSAENLNLNPNERIEALEQELLAKEEYLESANEELQTSYEEIKSSNEELQSVNEELQSTNEELETSKEELQSVNEELGTVNNELHALVSDLTRANNDMNNLLAGTGIATIFVDRQMRVLRFTPAAAQIINLLPSDLGRPVGHIVLNLSGYSKLAIDAQTVLSTLIPMEMQVQTTDRTWFTMRLQPYRTMDDVIDGVVISFIDITNIKLMEETLKKANSLSRLAVIVRDAQDAITVQDLQGQTIAWNKAAYKMYGFSEDEALKLNVCARIPKDLRKAEALKAQDLAQGKILDPYTTKRVAKNGSIINVWLIASPLIDETGKVYAISTTERSKDWTREAARGDNDNR